MYTIGTICASWFGENQWEKKGLGLFSPETEADPLGKLYEKGMRISEKYGGAPVSLAVCYVFTPKFREQLKSEDFQSVQNGKLWYKFHNDHRLFIQVLDMDVNARVEREWVDESI